jgi:hypothetical protein
MGIGLGAGIRAVKGIAFGSWYGVPRLAHASHAVILAPSTTMRFGFPWIWRPQMSQFKMRPDRAT